MNFLKFATESVPNFIFALVVAFFVFLAAMAAIRGLIRLLSVVIRGWPPEHIDVDGQFKKDKTNPNDVQKN